LEGYNTGADPRILAGGGDNEDAAVVRFPGGMGLVQTVDFFTPIVNDPYRFGRIAAANALSDVYAMGGEPLSAMNIVCFPAKTLPLTILRAILEGGRDKVLEAGAVVAGGHSVEDDEIKYGLAVSGVVDPAHVAVNHGLRPGDRLILTKPLGTGVLATAVKGKWENAEALENRLFQWAERLNRSAGAVIRDFGLRAATDITGFGLGGHLLEMLKASGVSAEIRLADVPFMAEVAELAAVGMIPAGSFANKAFCKSLVTVAAGCDPIRTDLVFDAQTSGGLLLGVSEKKAAAVCNRLIEGGDLAADIGAVTAAGESEARLVIR
jgi:selenide,water dikinase